MTPRAPVLAALGGLYVAQGLPYGFFTQALPVILRQHGVSLEHIGLASLLSLPWAAKALWAPWVDRWPRRRALLLLQAGTVTLLLVAAAIDPAHLGALAAVVLAANLLAATQDVLTDGLAVARLPPDALGAANALQVGGYRTGMILGGGALLAASGALGWSATVACLAGLVAVATLPAALLDERPRPAAPHPSLWQGWDWLTLPGARPWLGLLLLYKAGDYVAGGMLRPWLVDAGLSVEALGALLGGWGFGAGLAGAAAGGALVHRLGPARALLVGAVAQITGAGGYAATAALDLPPFAAVLWEHAVGGVATTALFAAMMRACRPERGGADFTLQASVVVLGSGLGAAVSGFIAARWGYVGAFVVGAALAALVPVVIAARVAPPPEPG